jgi:hypothetical protein
MHTPPIAIVHFGDIVVTYGYTTPIVAKSEMLMSGQPATLGFPYRDAPGSGIGPMAGGLECVCGKCFPVSRRLRDLIATVA